MKWRVVLILFVILALIFIAIYFVEKKEERKEKIEGRLFNVNPEDVYKLSLKRGMETIVFEKKNNEWRITSPIDSKADKYSIERIVDDFSSLKYERKVESEAKDLKRYGLDKSDRELKIWAKSSPNPVNIYFGVENPIDSNIYVRSEGNEVYLIASYLKSYIDKSLFDFRDKKIFYFEKEKIKEVNYQKDEIGWKAVKKDDIWHLQSPVEALADKNKIDDILYSISNSEAKEFLKETPDDEDFKKFNLDSPSILLNLKGEEELNFKFSVREDKDTKKVYGVSSLSPILASFSETLINDLDKNVESIREKRVAVFWSYDTKKLRIKKNGQEFYLEKNKEDKWEILKPEKRKADSEKVDNFIRKLEDLEAKEFVDSYKNLDEFELRVPKIQVEIYTEENKKEKKIVMLIGKEKNDKVYVKNYQLNYLFLVDSGFLKDIPEDVKDWCRVT
ncbi:MAG: DUF4340 domain-containing protein [Acidobacteriota bacterium]